MFTLDSNILISYLNDDPKIAEQLLKWHADNEHFFISVITEIEILSLPRLTDEELSRMQKFLREFTIISIDSQLGRIASEIRRRCRLTLGDSIIVATTQLTNSILITQDKEIIQKAKNLVRLQSIL